MEYRRLGNSGIEVSPICLGMMSYGSKDFQSWLLKPEDGELFFKAALDRGINFFDTAPLYSFGQSEEILGNAVAKLTQRRHVVLATKVGIGIEKGPNQRGLSRKYIHESVNASLKRLQTDYVDVLYCHCDDPLTPVEETLGALNDVVRAGKARYIGVSNFSAWSFARAFYKAQHLHGLRIDAAQIQYNLAYREEEREVLPFCRAEQIGVTTYSPLARGYLVSAPSSQQRLTNTETARATGDLKALATYGTGSDAAVAARLAELAAQKGMSASRIAIAWILAQRGVSSVVFGATEPAHLEEAVAATTTTLSDEEIAWLQEPYVTRPVMETDVPVKVGGERVK